jgi:hypothetical protein
MTALSPVSSTSRTDNTAGDFLRVVSVLEPGLPVELGTAAQPASYTVPLVFSRRVSPHERQHIEDPRTAARIAEEFGGGPGLHLVVSDRRLLVEGTTLEQLRDGLARALNDMLQELGRELRRVGDERAAAAEVHVQDERRRTATVHAAVSAITFE